MPTISVILPAYNAAPFLQKCLDSLFAQTFTDFEIVCVDDGSKDDTPTILQSQSDSRLRHFRQGNTGVYIARLNAISEAKGEYLAFCDSDDNPHTDWLKELYERAVQTDADITVCGYRRMNADNSAIISTEMLRDHVIDTQTDKIPLIGINTSPWNKLFKAKLFDHIFIPLTPPRIAEDALLISSVYINAGRVAFVPIELYDYIVNSTSAISNVRIDDIRATMSAFSELTSVSPKEAKNFLALTSFVNCAIIMPLLAGDSHLSAIKEAYVFLNREFPHWKTLLPLKYVLRSRFRGNIFKIYVAHLCYRLRLFPWLAAAWRFLSEKMRINVKW